MAKVPEVTDLEAAGNFVLIELINSEELITTKLDLGTGGADGLVDGAPQAYVLKLGPKVEGDWGFNVGDRICINTNAFVVAPSNARVAEDNEDTLDISGKPRRQRGWVQPHTIIGRIIEA